MDIKAFPAKQITIWNSHTWNSHLPLHTLEGKNNNKQKCNRIVIQLWPPACRFHTSEDDGKQNKPAASTPRKTTVNKTSLSLPHLGRRLQNKDNSAASTPRKATPLENPESKNKATVKPHSNSTSRQSNKQLHKKLNSPSPRGSAVRLSHPHASVQF